MKNKLPLVSVIIPCYNHEKFITDCIQSVIDQSYTRLELIIIDDGSSDGSFNQIKGMVRACEDRFENFYYRTRKNRGLCNTLNEALKLCNGEFVTIIASDDQMLINKIQLQVDYAVNYSEVTSFYGGVQLLDSNSNLIKSVNPSLRVYTFDDIFIHDFILYAPTQFHRLKDIISLGGFDPNVKIEDWDLLLRLTEAGKKILCIPELLSAYRFHGENTSSNLDFMCIEVLKVLDKYKEHKLYKKAKYEVLKQYKLKPIRKVSKVKYYFLKYYFKIKLFLGY